MPSPNFASRDLHAALRELAAADAPGVLERARERARRRAERLIEEALLEDLLAAAAELESRSGNRDGSRGTDAAPVPEAAVESAAGHDAGVGDAWWAYCVTWAEDAMDAAAGQEGVEPGTEVEAICDGELAALVSRVPLADYDDERLRAHLEDLSWVERIARRHEQVLDTALRDATVVPLRLCTLYRSLDGVHQLLEENRAGLREALIQVAGCVEWGVKVFADPSAGVRQDAAAVEPAGPPGAAYLLRRQNERALADRAGEVRARCAQVVHQQVAALARAATTNPPQRPEVHGRELTMLLNGAYLIERDRAPEVHAAVTSLQEEWSALGFAIELTGPWPAYNFVFGTAGMLT
ncbi:MAG TPA: GvpL/GvpF family gas vesicle protein [Solirubrobacteraceae bacterium]|nr:GvpL/GvpF family gas vesicle protein [Solirubrobacteraceae bacterium]